MAAQETTSNLLANTVFLLSRHPAYWQRIRQEAVEKGTSLLTYDALMSSTLLQNLLHECMSFEETNMCVSILNIFAALRLYPIFARLARTALRDTTLPVGGGPEQKDPIFVPKGYAVEWSQYAMNRDPSVFGDDVEEFNPDRWNDIRPGPWQYFPFGGGPRNCLGQQKVLVEAAYTLVRMATRFETLESRDERPWKGVVTLTCKNGNGCKVALYNRPKDEK